MSEGKSMGISFDAYVDGCTKRIVEVLQEDFDESEKRCVINAVTDELINHIGSIDLLADYEYLIDFASMKYIDQSLATIVHNGATQKDYNKALRLCERQKEYLSIFSDKNWEIPSISNRDLDNYEEKIKATQNAESLTARIARIDKCIDDESRIAEDELSVASCDAVLSYLDEMNEALENCKKQKVSVPQIKNSDIKKQYKHIASIKKTAEEKDRLHQESCKLDQKITNIHDAVKSTPLEWQEAISACKEQKKLLSECIKKKFPLPRLENNDLDGITAQFSHYLSMAKTDSAITENVNNLGRKKAYRQFLVDCAQQMNNIEMCQSKNWPIPKLTNADPITIKEKATKEKAKKDKFAKIKRRLIGIIAAIVLIAGLGFFAVLKSREGKIQVPFDSTYAVGLNCEDVVSELEKSGFVNIKTMPDSSGWGAANEVLSVAFDNSGEYKKGDYYLPDTNITIRYNSGDRKDVSRIFSGWQEKEYIDIVEALKWEGFTNITTQSVDTPDKEKAQLISKISLNKLPYMNGYCYIPLTAPIEIEYYALKIGIGSSNKDFIGQDCQAVVQQLEKEGFTNIKIEPVFDGLAVGNSVVEVRVNDSIMYKAGDTYSPDIQIVVKYSSNDRIDATKCLENWKKQDYRDLQEALKKLRLTNVTVKAKETTDKTKNQLVSKVMINNKEFLGGDCYLQTTVPIIIEYYDLKVVTGKSAEEFIKEYENYSDLVTALKNQGFTNIELHRTNDLNWYNELNGLLWGTREGSVKSISINGKTEFSSTDSFPFNSKIIIVVNTKETGCEDITIIEKKQ